jgi:hypothetical protein
MKYSKLIYSAGAIMVIVSSLMKILHLPHANTILVVTLMAMVVFQSYHVRRLDQRIKELEIPPK